MTTTHYLPSPTGCEPLQAIAHRFGGSIMMQSENTRVDYALPVHATHEVRDFLRINSVVEFESAYEARLPNGRIFGSGNVLSPDGNSIARDVSPDFGKPFGEHWLLDYKKIRPPVEVRGSTAVIATTLGVGYSHWLLDELPRLLSLKGNKPDAIIANSTSAYSREAFALHEFSGNIIQAKRYSHWACEELVVPSLGRLTPESVRALEDFSTPLRASAPSPFGERLYISREQARRRRVSNEAELWAYLSARGFMKIHLEELSWQQQIDAFRAAKKIVSPHGAGLANLVFCQAGTQVIELFNRSYVNGCFWQLAALKQLDYRPMVPTGDDSLAQMLKANRLDVVADLEQVRRVVGE